MIIGDNKPENGNFFKNNNDFLNNEKETFDKRIKQYKDNGKAKKTNIFVKDLKSTQYSNSSNQNEMLDKSLAMLNERLNNGTISLEEFNKKCNEIAKRRNN